MSDNQQHLRRTPYEVELRWIINCNAKELEKLRYYSERQQDFWEWYENTHDETNNELWDEFEKWEDSQEDSQEKKNDLKNKL